MNPNKNLPKWIGLAVIVVFVAAAAFGLMKKPASPKAELAAIEESLPSSQEDVDRFDFGPQPDPSIDGETSQGDQTGSENQAVSPSEADKPGQPDSGESAVAKAVTPPIPLPLPNQVASNPAEGILPELAEKQNGKGTVPTPVDPMPADNTTVKAGDLDRTEPLPVQKQEPSKPGKPPAPSVSAVAEPSAIKNKPPVEEQAPQQVAKNPVPVTQPTPVVQPPPLRTAPAPAKISPESVPLPNKESPVADASPSSVPLAIALTPVKSDSAPARNGATHRSAYLISPDDLNRYRQENSMVVVPHAADEQAGLATHAEALGFAEWLTRTHRAAGTLSASETYRLPLSSENKLTQVWAQDSTPQAANETKPFGIVRVRK